MRVTGVNLHYRARYELDRIRGMLRGRARLERKIGLKRMFFLMRTQTRYRVEQQAYYERAVVRKNIDSAAREHCTGWAYLRNDLARQNVAVLPRMQQLLSQYEPLTFRSLVELSASRIAPPLAPKMSAVLEEAYAAPPTNLQTSTAASRAELRHGIERMLFAGKSVALEQNGPKSVDGWMDAWKEYDYGVGAKL